MLRRLLIVFLMTGILGNTAFAQSAKTLPSIKKQKLAQKNANVQAIPAKDRSRAITGNEAPVSMSPVANPHPQGANHNPATNVRVDADLVQIGTTTYDLQTNNSTFRRVINHPNGDISAMWTFSDDAACGYADRGTGYNRYNAATGTWGAFPNTRLEGGTTSGPTRTGFGGMGMTESGRLFIINHSGGIGMKFMYSDNDGANWTQNNFTNTGTPNEDYCALWPRFAVTGNTIHVVASRQADPAECDYALNGLFRGLNYFRTHDGGNTWEGPDSIPGLNSTNFSTVGGDVYAMDAIGDTVVLVVGRFRPTLFKSTDGGDNWTMTIIQEISNPLFGGAADELLDPVATSDASFDIVLDSNGQAHVFYGRLVPNDDDPAEGYSYYPTNRAIMYWNESMGTNNAQVIGETVAQDYDNDGVASYDTDTGTDEAYFQEGVSMSSVAIDANDNLYLVYASVLEGEIDAQGNIYRGIFAVKSTDGGATWQGPVLIDGGNGTEAVYPMISRSVDDNIYFVYMADNLAGNSLQPTTPTHACATSRIMFATLPTADIVSPVSTAGGNPPQTLVLSYPYGLEGCPYSTNSIENYTLDYPDGALGFTIENASFDLDNPTPSDLHSYDLVFTDSDGNVVTESVDSLSIFADVEAPIIFGEPFEYVLDEDAGVYDPVSYFELFDTIDVIQNTPYVDLGAEVYDLLTIGNSSIDAGEAWGCHPTLTINNPVNTAVLGTYQVTYDATDNKGNVADQVVRVVRVIGSDLSAPTILVGDENGVLENGSTYYIELDQNAAFTPFDYLAYDNVDGFLTDNVTIAGADELADALTNIGPEDIGEYPITYTVTDDAGNTTTVTVTVFVQDTTPPVFDVSVLPATCNVDFTLPASLTAYDAGYGDIDVSGIEHIGGCVWTDCAGVYTITISACDGSNNCAEEDVIVTVGNPCTTNCNTSNINLDDPLCTPIGIEDPALAAAIDVYPNPSNGMVNVALGNVKGSVKVSVYNMAGAVVRNLQYDNAANATIQVNMADFSNGVYYVTILAEGGTVTKKVTLQK